MTAQERFERAVRDTQAMRLRVAKTALNGDAIRADVARILANLDRAAARRKQEGS